MAQKHTPTNIDPQLIKTSEENWAAFRAAIKYSLIGIAIIVASLALAFTDI